MLGCTGVYTLGCTGIYTLGCTGVYTLGCTGVYTLGCTGDYTLFRRPVAVLYFTLIPPQIFGENGLNGKCTDLDHRVMYRMTIPKMYSVPNLV